jgi:peptide/nickel transport system permease protein
VRKFILQRLASIVVTLWLLATIVFMLVSVLPGDVGRKVLGPTAPKEDVAAFNAQLGTDQPLFEQYVKSMKRVFTLDFGTSYQTRSSVSDIIFPARWAFGKLAVLAFIFTIPISIFAGISRFSPRDKLASRHRQRRSRIVIDPEFVTAAVLLAVFAVELGWGKAFANPPDGTSLFGQLEYLWLPAMAMAIAYFGYIARMTRAGVITALNADYTRTATMKGMSSSQVMRRHILRNALAPTITVISVQIGYLIGAVIGVERVFNYSGLGSTMLGAVGAHDVPVLQGAVLLVGIVYMLSTLLADLLIAFLNPRVRLETTR